MNTEINDYPATIDDYMALYEAPFAKLIVSYSHDQDDEWGRARHRTCIAHPETPAAAALRAIADEYYQTWADISREWVRCRDMVLRYADTFQSDLEARSRAENRMEQLVATIKAAAAGQMTGEMSELVRCRLTYDPPVCNIGTLGTNKDKGYLDVLWSALVNCPVK